MHRQRKSRFIPSHDQLESRSLLSTAVIDIENTSSYDISFAFRWSPHSAWTIYTEAPGQSEVLSTTRFGSAKPQVVYDAKVSTGSLAEQTLTASINRSNSAAASTGKLYAFENTRTGIALRALRGAHAISPSPTTHADTDYHTDADTDYHTHADADYHTHADTDDHTHADAELDRDDQ